MSEFTKPGTQDPSLTVGDVPYSQPEFKAKSFVEARAQPRGIGSRFILAALRDELAVGKEKAYFVKSFLDQVPADQSDVEFASNLETIITFKDELSDFIARKIIIAHPSLPEDQKAYLKDALVKYRQKINADKTVNEEFMREWGAWDSSSGVSRPNTPMSALRFYGLKLNTTNGVVDLTDGPLGATKSSIEVQRQLSDTFVQWNSKGYLQLRAEGKKPVVTRRIYLNPCQRDSVRIFEQVIDMAEQEGLAVQGKILDRSNHALIKDQAWGSSIRGDGIVFYAGEHADRLLKLVEQVYQANPDSFAGRRVSQTPYKIAEGIAIGDEPGDGQSLTSHRAELLESVVGKTKQALGIDSYQRLSPDYDSSRAVETFRQIFRQRAIEANVNPDNLAFNL